MGSNSVNPRGGSFTKRSRDHQMLYSAIHRARVTDVLLEKGTVSVTLENVAYSAQVTIPLLGLSAPPSLTDDTSKPAQANFKSASWGRYIPQVGDLLLVGFGSNGDLYALGYHAIYYKGFDVADIESEDTGGIGWGDTSAKSLKPGDWDFRSAGNSSLYLGQKASIASGINSIDINQPTDDITIDTPLLIGNIGISKLLYGSVERFLLPTDSEPKAIVSSRAGTAAQEATIKVKWNGGPTDGQELSTWSIGDVVDDDSTTAAIRLSNASSPQPVRKYFNCADNTGYINAYTEIVDAGGNYEVSSSLGTEFTWDTVLATWDISNLSLTMSSTESIDMTANTTFNITGTSGVILDSSSLIQFGGSGASEPMVLGIKWQSFISALMIALSTHTHPSPVGPTGPSADFAAQVTNLNQQAGNTLSSKVMGS